MTEKQEKIINASLELFSKEGYKATSTSKVAVKAGVSEGLIFRHFQNKEGLLNAIISKGEEKVKLLLADIVLETEPKEVIKKTIEVFDTANKNQEEVDFWKLQYKIKWEMEFYGEHKMEPLKIALSKAFDQLDFEEPEIEAELFLATVDGLATRFYLQDNYEMEDKLNLLKKKYSI